AKLLSEDRFGGAGTVAGSLMGSPAYMSPEQSAGEPVDHRSDVYSLGCVLFEAIAGSPPFVGASSSDLLAAHRFRAPPPLSNIVAAVPPWLTVLLARML